MRGKAKGDGSGTSEQDDFRMPSLQKQTQTGLQRRGDRRLMIDNQCNMAIAKICWT